MKIISWNVNGIRAIMKKDFHKDIDKIKPDILCLQETKAHPDQVDEEFKDFNHHYWNSAEKKGYSGTAIFSKIEPLNVIYDMGIKEHDNEGRIITLEFKDFYLTTVYTPNSKRGLERLPYRYEKWDPDFLKFVKKLEKKKPVVFCGDLNAAHKEIDIKNDKTNKTTATKPGNAGFTDQEREGVDKMINAGFVDTFRHFHPEEEKYTWWSYMFHARAKNVGWRIDYFFVSKKLIKKVEDGFILNDIMGSDHCPVGIILKD